MSKNILFIMCDQLRADYLSCYGHPKLRTPNIDALAARGLRFERAYCQAPLCGPSRTSFHTGRYMSSHGVMANEDATRVDELTLADYLRPCGYRSALVGKADSRKNPAMMLALGIEPDSDYARAAASAGYEPFAVHEGLLPGAAHNAYTDYLQAQGYAGENPWRDFAATTADAAGKLHSGWQLRSSIYPARVAEQHSETTYTTDRAIEFLAQQERDQPWCLHLSYIKPHWPYIAPSPYHRLYTAADVLPAVRADSELHNPHPVYQAFMEQEYSENFARDEVRLQIIPVYMGLIRQIDDQLGRLFDFMRTLEMLENTLVVFTSDHGDYLGDHWLGEKDLFHEPSAKIPLIVVNPDVEADATRGNVCRELVEAIDILPTLIDFAAGEIKQERVEGRSLLPLMRSAASPGDWRQFAVSEIDYSDRGPRTLLNVPPYDCRAVMIRDRRWKYVHYNRFRPQLFDMENDPQELSDLGADPAQEKVRQQMQQRVLDWHRHLKVRTGMPYENLAGMGPARDESLGIVIGRW